MSKYPENEVKPARFVAILERLDELERRAENHADRIRVLQQRVDNHQRVVGLPPEDEPADPVF